MILVLTYFLVHSRREINRNRQQLNDLNTFKTRMFTVVTHDLRSPVQAFLGVLDLIKRKLVTPEEIDELVPSIITKVEHLQDLMNNLFIWAKTNLDSRELELNPIDVHQLSNEIIERAKEWYSDKNVQFTNETDVTASIKSDQRLVRVILMNLLVNAAKYSSNNSEVIIRDDIEGNEYKLSVIDFGVGMSQEQLDKLFSFEIKSTTISKIAKDGTARYFP